jgi:superfamily II DNA or RNA helicase
VLCSTKALNQGLDIPNAQIGLICGLTSKALTMIQRVGRLVRIDPDNPDKVGSVVILYVKDSQEEKWLKKLTKTTNPSNIVWTSQTDLIERCIDNSKLVLIGKR